MTSIRPITPTYGTRGLVQESSPGIRRVAPTFGKELYLTHSAKASGPLVVESNSERLAAHVLSIDPRVTSFKQQPFTIDLIDRRICYTPEALSKARVRHKGRTGIKFYTPDFSSLWTRELSVIFEVKLEGFEGDLEYQTKLEIAKEVIEASGREFRTLVIPSSQRHPLRGNLPLLSQAMLASNELSDSLCSAIEEVCNEQSVTTAFLCSTLEISPGLIPCLLARGVISGNLAQQHINGAMNIAYAGGDLTHLQLISEVSK